MTPRWPYIALVLFLAGCSFGSSDRTPQSSQADSGADHPEDARLDGEGTPFHGRLLAVARSYQGYHLIDPLVRWSPRYCQAPPSEPALSRSTDEATHGRKLYFLFAKEVPATRSSGYVPARGPTPAGQAVVKEAWAPEEVADDGSPLRPVSLEVEVGGHTRRREFLPYARQGGRLYHAREKAGLFIMLKLDRATRGTDEGWVYGTVTADGRRVTSAGRVGSCMRCHREAPHDRLFGPAKKE
jgi:hypothetical protein